MDIRTYQSKDAKATMQLFYDTVHHINTKDYTLKQVNAWAPENRDREIWNTSFLNHYSLVVEEDEEIIGFGDISDDGYLDRFYVHHLWQSKGVGKLLLQGLEEHVSGDITTHASITAKPFFIKHGYEEICEQTVDVKGVKMNNFVLLKRRSN